VQVRGTAIDRRGAALARARRMPSITTVGGALATLGLAGCLAYSPGSFRRGGDAFEGQLVRLDCLELGVAGQHDAVAPGPVVSYEFGNRCDHAIAVDLGAVRATGRTPDGHEVALVAYDPYREIKPLRLEARSYGHERLEYRKAVDLGIDLVQVCVELEGITQTRAPARVCMTADVPPQVAEVSP
jgi:hypothetical protein